MNKTFEKSHPSLTGKEQTFRDEPNYFIHEDGGIRTHRLEMIFSETNVQLHTLDKAVVRAAIGKTTAPKIVCASVKLNEKMWAVLNERKRILQKLGLDQDGD